MKVANNVTELMKDSLDDVGNTLKQDSLSINNRLVQFKKEQDKLIDETKEPSFKLIDEIKDDYNDLYKKLVRNIERFFNEELESFKRSRRDVGRGLTNILNRRGSRTSKEIASLKEVFDKARENNVRKTQNSFEDIERTVAREASELLDQERNTRSSIINLTEKIIKDLADSVQAITALYVQIRYGRGQNEAKLRRLRSLVKSFRPPRNNSVFS